MYDWANSAFQTTIIAGVFPIYFKQVAAAGMPENLQDSRYLWATTIAIVIMAVIAPILGAIADAKPIKKLFLAVFVIVGAAATVGMWWIREGDWVLALGLFALGNITVAGSIVFTNRCCRSLRSRRNSTVCLRPGMRWVTSVGAYCSPSTS